MKRTLTPSGLSRVRSVGHIAHPEPRITRMVRNEPDTLVGYACALAGLVLVAMYAAGWLT